MKKETVLVAASFYTDREGAQHTKSELRPAWVQVFAQRSRTPEATASARGNFMMAADLGWAYTQGEFLPVSTLKRQVPLHSPTFSDSVDSRNKAGVGRLHGSRISTKVVPLDKRYVDENGAFVQEW